MALETVLLAVGGRDSARAGDLEAAVTDVAGPADARVVIAHVFDEESYGNALDRLDYGPDAEPDPDEVAGRQGSVRTIRDGLRNAGIAHDVRGLVDEDVGGAVVTLAEDVGADLVIVGGTKRSPAGKAVFGSTAQQVLLNAPCPVTFVRSE